MSSYCNITGKSFIMLIKIQGVQHLEMSGNLRQVEKCLGRLSEFGKRKKVRKSGNFFIKLNCKSLTHIFISNKIKGQAQE